MNAPPFRRAVFLMTIDRKGAKKDAGDRLSRVEDGQRHRVDCRAMLFF